MKKWKKVLLVIVLMLIHVPADANIWIPQYKLEIYVQQPNKTFNANGEDNAKMNIVLINKTTNILEIAQSDVQIFLRSKGILGTHNIVIKKGNAQSDDISLTSTEPGIVVVIAEAVNFVEAATTSVEFSRPPEPSELNLTAQPDENIIANGIDSTLLTVKLYEPNGDLFVPQTDIDIDISTNRGDRLRPIQMVKNKHYAQTEFNTTKEGVVTIKAKSPDFLLENIVSVTFIPRLTILTFFLALFGGLVGGFVKYYQENKKKDKSLGMFAAIHLIFGFIIYIGAIYGVPFTNVFKLPYDNWDGAFIIGFTGGLFGSVIIYLWGQLIIWGNNWRKIY